MKAAEYFDFPESVTVLTSCIPILLEMIINRTPGTINLVNPGPIRLSEVAENFKNLVDPAFTYRVIGLEVRCFVFY